ncbi:helix-turn-helix transcriptional regulator [Solihabitans fulvus]|uniref:Helix-turn-helix transcriptional regulator n=1 Tax=Solihabitans fulvus TaxID=1892852 RepID=A0A5B2W808_9PSEU|nr:helix-turn-helix domain-containing protein [Solihabitans fulvus]KAA2246467.1 helix-turn-helix transcriptional regulator [Solihabitans fulvus]
MSGPLAEPFCLPRHVWADPQVQIALGGRDVAALLRVAQRHGASQARLAAATGLSQGRLSEIANGRRAVIALEVFERIAAGLALPDSARMRLGLAPVDPAGLDHLAAAARAEIIAVWPNQSAAAGAIRAHAATASRIDVLAVRGLGLLGMSGSLLRSTVTAKPVQLRVLLLDPDSSAASHRAAEIGEADESFRSGIDLSVVKLRELAATGVQVQAWLYSATPIWRSIALDDMLFVSTFTGTREGHRSAMYQIAPSPHGTLHHGIRRVWDELLSQATRVI